MESVEKSRRRPYTAGWESQLQYDTSALPIKKAGRVIPVQRIRKEVIEKVEPDDEQADEQEETIKVPLSEFDDFEYINEPKKRSISKRSQNSHTNSNIKTLTEKGVEAIKTKIAEICNFICFDPQTSLKRKIVDAAKDEPNLRLNDLFSYISHSDHRVAQCALLSTLVIFKDIVPGYQIRTHDSIDKDVMLKKETKRIMDYEHALLKAYQRYLNILDDRITAGLGSSKKDIHDPSSPEAVLGYHALKCQCELLCALSHFNLRDKLIASVVSRATQPSQAISSLCCKYLTQTVERDIEGECSYAIVRCIAHTLIAIKHDVSGDILHVLEKVKVRIHEDEARDLRKMAKKDRKKRKREDDDVEARILESEGINPVNVKRAQADCLREMCLIYFRILKQKIGFRLLPLALEGLARLTHLINMDTVMDLLAVLKRLLDPSVGGHAAVPLSVKLHCIYCALRTLSGPGQELEIDDEPFVSSLAGIIQELPIFDRWDLVFECVDLCLVKKRETRKHYVMEILYTLFHRLCHLEPKTMAAALATLHSVMIHYPNIRQAIHTSIRQITQSAADPSKAYIYAEEQVEDLAMNGLLKTGKHHQNGSVFSNDNHLYDNHMFWGLSLCQHVQEPQVGELIRLITSGNHIMAVAYNAKDAKLASAEDLYRYNLQNIDDALDALNSADSAAPPMKARTNLTKPSNSAAKPLSQSTASKSAKNKVDKPVSASSGTSNGSVKEDYRKKKSNRSFQAKGSGSSASSGGAKKAFSSASKPYTSKNSGIKPSYSTGKKSDGGKGKFGSKPGGGQGKGGRFNGKGKR